jgi:hypothetical protein
MPQQRVRIDRRLVSGLSNSSTVASYPLAARASSSSLLAPKPARRIRWAINPMSSLLAIVDPPE